MEELCSRSIVEAILVGSGAYDTLVLEKEHLRIVLVSLSIIIVAYWHHYIELVSLAHPYRLNMCYGRALQLQY